MTSLPRVLTLATLATMLVQCREQPKAPTATPPSSSITDSSAALGLLFAPSERLAGDPNLISLSLTYADKKIIERQGDIPALNEVFKAKDLPIGKQVHLSAHLFKDNYLDKAKTHDCESDELLELLPGKEVSATILCRPLLSNATVGNPVVFVKTGRVQISLNQSDSSTAITAIDWNKDHAFAAADNQQQKISLRQVDGRLDIRLGGAIEYTVAAAPSGSAAPLARLLAGAELSLEPTAGRLLDIADKATMTLNAQAFTMDDQGTARAILPFKISSPSGLGAEGKLVEEDMRADFTIASYNVENFFDQKDDPASAGYGDYRIEPNDRKQNSNWGELVDFEGKRQSFTQVKISGIRKVLTAIAPRGPEVVGLVEVESQQAVDQLFDAVKDLGYTSAYMADVPSTMAPTAVHTAILSKFPVKSYTSIVPETPAGETENLRAIVRAQLDVMGHDLYVYVGHWKSKGGGESLRIQSAKALNADVTALLASNPQADYVIMGDLNSNYNEAVTIEDRNNDTRGVTGINHILGAQGDELKVAKGSKTLKYNLHYELRREERRTCYYPEYGWGTLDNMIIGSGMFNSKGVSYVDNSFRIPKAQQKAFAFLFDEEGHPRRWLSKRHGNVTEHAVGGYSDHLPIFAHFQVMREQNLGRIWLFQPGTPDKGDPTLGEGN